MNGNDCIEFEEEHHDNLVKEFVENNKELFGEFVRSLDKETLREELLSTDNERLVDMFIEAHQDEYHEFANQEASEAQAWEETKHSLMNDR